MRTFLTLVEGISDANVLIRGNFSFNSDETPISVDTIGKWKYEWCKMNNINPEKAQIIQFWLLP